MPARSTDPLTGFHFQLDLGGVATGYFTEVSGLGSENEVIEHKIVSQSAQQIVQKLPGRLKWGDITLKRGITSAMDIWDWRKKVEDGNVDGARTNGSIIMLDQTMAPVAQWDFEGAWPSKISGPQAQADSNNYGIEELTIVHEYITRVQ
jgi:phage tail-like protein